MLWEGGRGSQLAQASTRAGTFDQDVGKESSILERGNPETFGVGGSFICSWKEAAQGSLTSQVPATGKPGLTSQLWTLTPSDLSSSKCGLW